MKCGAVRVLTGLVAATAMLAATEAKAAASVAVENMFDIRVFEAQSLTPEQRSRITITSTLVEWSRTEIIRGRAALDVDYGVGDPSPVSERRGAHLTASARAEADGFAKGTYVMRVAIDVTNGTGGDLSQLFLASWFSSFSPYESANARVDRAPREYALFDTWQSGEGIVGGFTCDTRLIQAGDYYAHDSTPPTLSCGVPSPDHSMSEIYLQNIGAGGTVRLDYMLSVTVEAFSVIEPVSLALFAPSALAVFALRRRRAA